MLFRAYQLGILPLQLSMVHNWQGFRGSNIQEGTWKSVNYVEHESGLSYLNYSIQVWTKEERRRISLLSRIIDNSVDCSNKAIVRHTHEEIANINNKSPVNWRCRDPMRVCV